METITQQDAHATGRRHALHHLFAPAHSADFTAFAFEQLPGGTAFADSQHQFICAVHQNRHPGFLHGR